MPVAGVQGGQSPTNSLEAQSSPDLRVLNDILLVIQADEVEVLDRPKNSQRDDDKRKADEDLRPPSPDKKGSTGSGRRKSNGSFGLPFGLGSGHPFFSLSHVLTDKNSTGGSLCQT
jgi:hypothetical protein